MLVLVLTLRTFRNFETPYLLFGGTAPDGARAFVESRTSQGGTAAARRRELAEAAAEDLRTHRDQVTSLVAEQEAARTRLLHDAADIARRR